MITFTRGSATAYLVALAVWVAGFIVITVTGLRGGGAVSAGRIAVLLICMFAADAAMLAIAARMGGADRDLGAPRLSSSSPQARWLLLLVLRWVFLLCGVAAPTAFRALDSRRPRSRR